MERPLSSNFLYTILKQTYLKCYCFFLNGILAIGNDAVIAYQTFHKQIYNFPYSIDTTKFIDKKIKSSKKIKFIYLGQLIERKGVIEAIEGFILNKSTNIEFTIVGGGVLEQRVKHLIKDDMRIKQLPYADYDSIPELLYDHDVLIFPSKHDGWALTLVESMSAGLFIMGTNDTSSFNEYIINQKNGIKISVCKNEINHKIQWCIDNIDLVMDAGPRNQSFIRESLSSATIAAHELRRLLEAY
jgi:glycosyltransferase involved in cell wall biosynthesis